MPREKTVLSTNPIRVARLGQGKTLHEFAADLEINYQAVYLSESGVYPHILPTIKKYLVNTLKLDPRNLDLSYYAFVYTNRKHFEYTFGPDWHLPEPLLGDSPIVVWRESLNLSRSALSKGICVQPSMLSRVENKKMAMLPSQLIEALKAIGWTKSLIDEMDYRVNEFFHS